MAISADSGHSTALYRYRRSITPRAHLLKKVGSRYKHTKCDALFLVKQDEQQAGQAQQEGLEQQGDDVKGADGVAEGCAGGNGHQHLGAVGDDALKDAGEGVRQGGGALGADAVSCQHSAGNQVHPLNSSLVFFLPYHTRRKKQPRPLPAALSAFWRTAKKNSTITKMREKVQLPSPAMFAV